MTDKTQTPQWNHMVSFLTTDPETLSANGCLYVESYLLQDQRVANHQQFEAKKPSGQGSSHV